MSPVLRSASVVTPVGPLTVIASDDGVHAAGFTGDIDSFLGTLDRALRARPHRRCHDLGDITDAVCRYFAGDVHACDHLPVVQPGGPFATAAWRAMRSIPAGSSITYLQLAERAGRALAARAAGAACASNRIALIVPCHRVLRTDGGLGGYLWGLPVKRWLLAHEEGGHPVGADRGANHTVPWTQ